MRYYNNNYQSNKIKIKSMSEYWHTRQRPTIIQQTQQRPKDHKTPHNISMIGNQATNTSTKIKTPLKDTYRSKNKMNKSLNIACDETKKLDAFYKTILEQEYSKMAVRCYQHNSELILYCIPDKKLICANCMFGQSSQPRSESKRTQQNHSRHSVKQIKISMKDIDEDIMKQQYSLKGQLNKLNSCLHSWEKQAEAFQKISRQALNKLEEEYDKIQMEMSKKYLKIKGQIEGMAQIHQENQREIIKGYKYLKKMALPTRYPTPILKHCWLSRFNQLISQQIDLNFDIQSHYSSQKLYAKQIDAYVSQLR